MRVLLSANQLVSFCFRAVFLILMGIGLAACDAQTQNRNQLFGGAFAKGAERAVVPRSTVFAILQTSETPGNGQSVNADFVNRASQSGNQVAFIGTLEDDTEVTVTAAEQRKDEIDLERAGARRLKDGERVEIKLNNDPIEFAVDQLLGGLLSVNYVAASPLEGTVTFETREPILASQVPTVLRDILASRNLVMKLINGVYQIGSPAIIEQLEANSAIGNSSELATEIITVRNGNLGELADVVSQILPSGATINAVPSDGVLIVRANPADLPAIRDLVETLVSTGAADDLIAIVPLKESPPEQVAASVLTYYETSQTPASRIPVVIPLENQQALLLGAKTQSAMNNVRKLVRGLDRDLRDSASLRIIPLRHVPAAEIAAHLNAIFGNGAAPTVQSAAAQADADGDIDTSVLVPANIRGNSANASVEDSVTDAGPAAVPANGQVSIVPDERNNALLVFATFKEFKRIREVVRTLDLPLAQVVIEATIVEVDINDALGYGVQFFLNSSDVALRSSTTITPTDPGQVGLFANIGASSVNVVLSALQSVTNVRVISSPYLTVLDGKPARLSIGDQVPFLTASTDANSDGTTTTTNQIEVRDTGIILEVTPRVGADNSVLLDINQEVSSVAPGGAEANELTPTIQQRSIRSDIVVQSGKTALLGGLIQDSDTRVTTRVPVVSQIPVVGGLFKQTRNDLVRTELLVMITPRVVRKPSQLENITRQLRGNLVGASN